MDECPTLPFESAEEWRAIPGYDGFYEASSLGRVRSLSRVLSDGKRLTGRVLLQSGSPYLRVQLSVHGKSRSRAVHVLIAETFHDACPEGMEVRHLDDDKLNNAASNLCWGTRSENIQDRRTNGIMYQLNRTRCASGLHEWTPENTMTVRGRNESTYRVCRECRNGRRRQKRAEARVA